MKKISSILIANRGEPVRRAMSAFKKMGIEAVTIAVTEDLATDWVAESSRCFEVSSYLNAKQIVEIALKAKVDAVWPGWGFLSENAAFAKAAVDAGLIWIGPTPDVIEQMGSKAKATVLAKKAGLKTIPEETIVPKNTAEENLSEVKSACHKVGYPILLKPALGGGGQGQMVVNSEAELMSAWQNVFQINKNLFQSGPILVQCFFSEARHIETQILADKYGNVVVLGERECSVQRRNQKVIEEAPSPALSPEQRVALIESSASFARMIGYQNAGTIEFLYSRGEIFFLEMNTRLQVEHPVTEETIRVDMSLRGERSEAWQSCGEDRHASLRSPRDDKIDLVCEMVKVACEEKLSFTQSQIYRYGHALEARIYAEDPEKDYQPSPGDVSFYRFPQRKHVRIESAFSSIPARVSPSFDPMIAKMIVWGKDRNQAIQNLIAAIDDTVVLGVPTNLGLCRRIVEHPEFCSGNYATNFLAKHPEIKASTHDKLGLSIALAASIRYVRDMKNLRDSLRSNQLTSLPHLFRKIPKNGVNYHAFIKSKKLGLRVEEKSPQYFHVGCDGWDHEVTIIDRENSNYTAVLPNGSVFSVCAHEQGDVLQLSFGGKTSFIKLAAEGASEQVDPHVAPMAGQIVNLCVNLGDVVSVGQELFQIESMKMITAIRAVRDGKVECIFKSKGDPVKSGECVVQIPFKQEENSDLTLDTKILGSSCVTEAEPVLLIKSYFQGFDVSKDDLKSCLHVLESGLLNGQVDKKYFEKSVAQVLKNHLLIRELFTRSEHIVTFLAEQEDEATRLMPKEQETLLKNIFGDFGITALSALSKQPRLLIHCFQAFLNEGKEKEKSIVALLQLCQRTGCGDETLIEPLVKWLKTAPSLDETANNDIWALLYLLSPTHYYELGQMPVALEFLPEYRMVKKNPAYDIDQVEYEALLKQLDWNSLSLRGPATPGSLQAPDRGNLNEIFQELDFKDFPDHLKSHLKKWFQFFKGRELRLPKVFRDKEVHLFELVAPQNEKSGKEIPPRFIVLSLVSNARLEKTSLGVTVLPEYEQAAMYAYRALRLVQRTETHRPNNVFLLSKDQSAIPWRTRDGDAGKLVLTPETVRQASSRVMGFALGIQIEATEVVMPVLNDADDKVYWTVLEIRHATEKGIISRPPFLIEEREPKKPLDDESQMNERQHRMGKLLNRDRAMLLFDNGEYQEMFFPEVDDEPEIGLNVYQGNVNGVSVLAYAGDFRFRGGALGEREGKKLASVVVLSYLMNKPLVGFHDGAGANIKESVSSLGWAGSYFSAIAHTGGFSTPEKFSYWFKNHIGKDYFEKVIRHFGLKGSVDEIIAHVHKQLVHFHLHVGATVGMLVYGASIAHASIMNDQPECYRVLTGAGTVKRVLGEKGTNYSLGGAKAHSQESGDIEMVFSSEEQVIDQTRKLLKIFSASKSVDKIQRDASRPVLEVPKKAGIILGRDAIKAHVDHGDFFEIRATLKRANGILTGYASLAGRAIAMVATATDYGIAHANGFKKALQLAEAAQDLSLPMIMACGAQWEAPSTPVPVDYLQGREEILHAFQIINVPKISLALGPRSIERGIHFSMDMTVYVERGDETESEMERAHALCPFVFKSLSQAFDHIAKILAYLPPLPTQKAVIKTDDVVTRNTLISLPKEMTKSYNMRAVIAEIFDRESFVEFWSGDKLPLLCGFATLNGQIVGVIADNPEMESGAQNIDSIQKFTRFNRICERFNLPIVELNDSPAFRPGHEQEHRGIQGVGGRSIREESLSRNPKIALTLRQNYGGRFIHANLITLGAPRVGLAVKGANIGVMGAKGAVGVLYAKKLIALPESERASAEAKWQKEYEDNQLNPEHSIKLGYLKKLIEPTEIRRELCAALKDFL